MSGSVLQDLADDVLGTEWTDEEPARIIAELAVRFADPDEVAFHLDAAQRAHDGRYSPDDTVDEIIRDVLSRVDDSVGLQTLQASVQRVAGVRQPATVKGYIRDAIRDGPFRPDPRSIGRWVIERDADRGLETEVRT